MKHIPERTCIVCRKKGDKSNFFKVVLNKSGEVAILGETQLCGRGAYICKNAECILKAKKTRALSRVFKTSIPDEIYGELESKLGTDKS